MSDTITWAVTDALRIYRGHELIATIPAKQYARLIQELAGKL